MMEPDEFKVDAVDYGNMVGVAFSRGAGESRLRWGCRLQPDQARALAIALNAMADKINPRPPSTLDGMRFSGAKQRPPTSSATPITPAHLRQRLPHDAPCSECGKTLRELSPVDDSTGRRMKP